MKKTTETKVIGNATYKGIRINIYHNPKFDDYSFALINPISKQTFLSDPIYSSKTETIRYAKNYINNAIKLNSKKYKIFHQQFLADYKKIFG